MAKQQVYQLDNGSMLVYQKQSAFNGYSFAIGFKGGAQLDGKYKGLSHLLEHLLFRTPNPKSTNVLLDNIIQYTVDQNAFTSQYALFVTFSSVYKNVEFALENCMTNMLTRKSFSKTQIAREIEVVKHEINMTKDSMLDELPSATTVLLQSLQKDYKQYDSMAVLGNSRTLNQITPELLSNYVKRYFNLDNLIVSVTTNKPIEEVVELCNKHIYSKLERASSPKYIIAPPPHQNSTTRICWLHCLMNFRKRLQFQCF